MGKVDLINIFLSLFAVILAIIPPRKVSQRKIFFLGVVLFGAGSIFSLVKYSQVAEIYFRLALICLFIGVVKAILLYKDGD